MESPPHIETDEHGTLIAYLLMVAMFAVAVVAAWGAFAEPPGPPDPDEVMKTVTGALWRGLV